MIRVATEAGFYVYVHEDADMFEIFSFLERKLPVIVDFKEPSSDEGHFAVVCGVGNTHITLQDPWNGKEYRLPQKEFIARWHDGASRRWIMVISDTDINIGRQYAPKERYINRG
jgi:predicted double-glycine peptidase